MFSTHMCDSFSMQEYGKRPTATAQPYCTVCLYNTSKAMEKCLQTNNKTAVNRKLRLLMQYKITVLVTCHNDGIRR